MVTYIYFVKCPNCDDEHFDFFDDAKDFALGHLSQKPIITQTEVCRNDFGECTDSADLGTVWSWKDIMDNDLDSESLSENAIKAGGFRTDGYRTALACYDSDDFDINVEFGMQDEEEYEVEDQLYLLRPGQTVADLVVYLSRECGFTSIYVYGETSATRAEMRTATRFTTVPGNHDYRHYGTIADRLVEECTKKGHPTKTVFSKAETFGISEGIDDFDDFDIGPQIDEFTNPLDFDDSSTDILWVAENLAGGDIVAACWSDSESTAHNILTAAFRERTGGDPEDCYIYQAETSDVEHINANPELLVESQERKPIPDGMTIDQLVEEMEENEDTVECTWCEELFDKSECRKEVNLGWLCSRCEAAIKSRGEPLTFRENNYWDFLDEDAESPATGAPAKKNSWEYDPNGEYEFTAYDDYDNEVPYTVPHPEVLEALAELIDDDYVRFQTEDTEDDEFRTVQALKDAGKLEEFLIDGFDTHISNYIIELNDYFEKNQNEHRAAAIKDFMDEYAEYEDEGPGGGAFSSWADFWRWKEG